LHSDIQKILRNARKLPDKTPHFFKELNRLKRAALALGFTELLEGMAAIFERECSLLPSSAHPVTNHDWGSKTLLTIITCVGVLCEKSYYNF
jgi:hypothetical protein